MTRIRICVGPVSVAAELEDNQTAARIVEVLPLNAQAALWGDEIYFGLPVFMAVDDTVDQVEVGDIAYWSPGHAFCIFFGRTPMSRGNEIRPASPVSVFGHILGDARTFTACAAGDLVSVELVQ